jgi:hypothetical protein
MPISKRVADLITAQVFSNKTLDSTCTFESLLQSYASAGLPVPSLTGRLAWLTDGTRGLFADTGVQWVPVAGDIANVKNFNAVGDGIVNDSAAILAAIATGKPVYFPVGTYLVNSILPLSFAGQSFYGDGPNSIIRATNPGLPMWKPTEPLSGLSWYNLRFEGSAVDSTTVQRCIETEPGSPLTNVLIQNCQFSGADSLHGFNWAAVANDESHRWRVLSNVFERLQGSASGFGYGFITGHSNAHAVAFNNFTGTPGRGRHAVYLSGSSSHCRVIGNVSTGMNFEHFTMNADNVNVTCKYNVMSGNVCIGGGTIAVGDSGAIGIYGKSQFNLIAQNIIQGYAGEGIAVSDSGIGGENSGNTIFGNVVERVHRRGIAIMGAQDTLVVSNHVIECSQDNPGAGTHAGIDVRSNAAFGVQAVDNTVVVNNLSYGDDQRCGFNIDPTSPLPTNTVLKGNVFGNGVIGNGYQLNGAIVQIDGVLHRTLTYSGNMTTIATAERETVNRIVVTNASAFTVNTPDVNDALAGKLVTIQIYNSSGGSLGTATFNGFHLGASWTQPINTKNRSITFRYDGTGWAETYRSAADVATPGA